MSVFPVAKYHNGETYYFNVYDNCYISGYLRDGHIWEPHMHTVFETYVKPESIVVEGGCHIGTHTLKLASLGAYVFAFEPLPSSYEKLMYNLDRNGLSEKVSCFQKGLSDSAGQTTFAWVSPDNPGASGLCVAENKPSWGKKPANDIVVDLITLDSLHLDRVDFIKLDVEGAEERVIRGAVDTIRRCKPVITLEVYSDDAGHSNMEYTATKYAFLLELGYTLQALGGPDYLFLPA